MLSWFFGSKRRVSDTLSAHDEAVVVGHSVEDFSFVETAQQSTYYSPVYPKLETPNLPYPVGPQSLFPTPYPPQQYQIPQTQDSLLNKSSDSPKHSSTNPLSSVPFRLSKHLDGGSSGISLSELSSIRALITKIQEDLNGNSYDYDFELERTILEECWVQN